MDRNQKEALAMRVSVVTILGNLALTIFKLAAGVLAHSGAMISDAVHSGSDVMSTFVVIAGVKLSGQESDQEHPFGHERFEFCVWVTSNIYKSSPYRRIWERFACVMQRT